MATKLIKPKEIVLTGCFIRDRGKLKNIVMTIYPTGEYELRLSGARKGGETEVCGSLSDDYYQKVRRKAG